MREPSKFFWCNFRYLKSSLRDNVSVGVCWLHLKSSGNLHVPTSIVLATNALCKCAFVTTDTLFCQNKIKLVPKAAVSKWVKVYYASQQGKDQKARVLPKDRPVSVSVMF